MSSKVNNVPADEALSRLKASNGRFVSCVGYSGDISPEVRKKTADEGQSPYAVIVACSDSRVIPECIFDAGIGELFVIRTAGNTLGPSELASVEYAVEHLGCKLVVIMGHEHCGAVKAAVSGGGDGHVKAVTDRILKFAGEEKDETKVCRLNVKGSTEALRNSVHGDYTAVGAIYFPEDGKVEFLE